MSVSSNGMVLSPEALRTLIIMGGDTSAVMVSGTENNPATRGGHMMIRYQAAMSKFYKEWHGRALHAMYAFGNNRANATLTLKDTIAQAMGQASTLYVPLVWDNVAPSLQAMNGRVNQAGGLEDASRRYRLAHATGQVAVASVAAKFGSDRHKVDFDDARSVRVSILDILASQGATSAELVGRAVDTSGQLMEVRSSYRSYLEQSAKYESDRAQADASSRAARRSGIGTFIGISAKVLGAL